MKKLLCILFAFVSLQLHAQQVPNGSFEQWEMDSKTGTLEPVGWDTKNFALYNDTNVRKSYSPKTGNLACGLKTEFIANVIVVPGIMYTTFPVSQQPATLTGYIKGNLALDDTSLIYVTVKKDTTIVGEGYYFLTQSLNNYIKFIVSIDYTGSEMPDSCSIAVFGGTGSTIDDTASYTIVDDFALTFNASGLQSGVSINEKITLYPQPADNILNIQTDMPYAMLDIISADGRLLATFNDNKSIDISQLPSGPALLVFRDAGGRILSRKTFIRL